MKFLAFLFILLPIALFVGAFYVPIHIADYMLLASPFTLAFAIYFDVKVCKPKFMLLDNSKTPKKDIQISPGKHNKDTKNIKQAEEVKRAGEINTEKNNVAGTTTIAEYNDRIEIPVDIAESFTAPAFDSSPDMNWDEGYNFDK